MNSIFELKDCLKLAILLTQNNVEHEVCKICLLCMLIAKLRMKFNMEMFVNEKLNKLFNNIIRLTGNTNSVIQ